MTEPKVSFSQWSKWYDEIINELPKTEGKKLEWLIGYSDTMLAVSDWFYTKKEEAIKRKDF